MTKKTTKITGKRMKEDGNERAKRDPLYWTVNSVPEGKWNMFQYLQTGEATVSSSLIMFAQVLSIPLADKTCYEIGCGAGRLTVQLAQHFKHVMAMDVSGEMLNKARETLANQGLDNVEFIEGNGVDFQPTEDASVDVVYSANVFQHIPDPTMQMKYLLETGRVLKLGGLFMISLYGNMKEYLHLKGEWEKRRQAGDPMGWSELGALELPRYETSMSTAVEAALVYETLEKAGLRLFNEVGKETTVWWIMGGRA